MLPFLPFLLVGLFLALVGWGGLAAIIIYTLPTLEFRWLFFFCWTLGLSGTLLPFMYLLHGRITSSSDLDAGVIVREAVLVGIYGGLLAWLQLGRVLTPMLAMFLAVGLVVFEVVLRVRERSRFKPKAEEPHE